MASRNSDWHSVSGIQWTVERPLPNRPNKSSPIFMLNDIEVYFELNMNNYEITSVIGGGVFGPVSTCFAYILHLRMADGVLPDSLQGLQVHIHVKSQDKVTVLPLSTRMVIATFQDRIEIWRKDETNIQKQLPNFHSEGVITFFVNFTKETNESSFLQLGEQESTVSVDKSIQTSPCLDNRLCFENLSKDFSTLLTREDQADVILTCGDQTAHVHSIVLSSRSEVLAAALTNDMIEGRTRRIEIREMDPDIFPDFVKYLYSGTFSKDELTLETAKRLFEAGDRHAVKGLTDKCARFLVENLSVENACEILVLADAHNHQELKEQVQNYILDKEIHLLNVEWVGFHKRYPVLANEIHFRFCMRFKKY